ncbi:unnamed protein product, partial [Thlaspi arvense]
IINPLEMFCLGPVDDNLFEWEAAIKGPKYSPYGGGIILSMHFSPQFPMKAVTILMTFWGMLLTPRLELPDKVNENTL